MLKFIYTIFDEKSGIYSDPYTAVNQATAERDFSYACTQEVNSNLYRHKMDYHLLQLGEYDDSEGTFTTNRKLIISGSQLINKE